MPELERQVGTLWVLELCPADGTGPPPPPPIPSPRRTSSGLTSSALINHTFDGLLSLCRPGAFVVALGPTTPWSPVLFDHGVHVLAGSDVIDEAAALYTLGQGASFREVQGVRRIAPAAPGQPCVTEQGRPGAGSRAVDSAARHRPLHRLRCRQSSRAGPTFTASADGSRVEAWFACDEQVEGTAASSTAAS